MEGECGWWEGVSASSVLVVRPSVCALLRLSSAAELLIARWQCPDFKIVFVWPFGLAGLWLRYAALQNLIPSFPWRNLYPGAIQGKEGIKFCHLATLTDCSERDEVYLGPRVERQTSGLIFARPQGSKLCKNVQVWLVSLGFLSRHIES